jgi:O-antigen ligase
MNPNGVGALYGMFFIPVLAFEFISSKPGLTKFAILIVLILALIECIASQSRAGLLAGFTSLFILVLLRKKFQARVIIILSVVLISGGIIGSNPSNNLFRRFIYRNEQTLLGSGRLPVWIDTWGRFLEHPILGSGLGVSNTGLAPVDVAFTTAGYTIEKGNSYLGMLEELGIVGSLIFIGALIIPLFIYSWTYINSSDPIDTGTTQVLISIMVAGLVNAMFEAWILSAGSVLCYTYWLFMTLLFASNR